ncbi:hypothetical protein SUDANB145_04002 [Streptomyces sp. enrichment culture]|uniref:hypothetical protein n=1 Tax=Streptomyces sp. enrichment culture TaxID=1795815 RepID=UPI003F554F82
MAGIHLPEGGDDVAPALFPGAFEEAITQAERELAAQRRRLRRMRRERRRRQRRNAARWARAHGRTGLVWGGALACAAGVVFALLGMDGIAVELFKTAAAAWIAAAAGR